MKPNNRRRQLMLPALLVVALFGNPMIFLSQAAVTPGAVAMAGGTVVAWGD